MPADDKSRIGAAVDQVGSILKQGMIESDPDATLIALGRKFEVLSAELAALQKEEVDVPSSIASKEVAMSTASDERIEAVLTSLYPIERAIIAIPAMTVVGLGVKARHAAHVLSHYWTDSPERLDWDAQAVRLLIESTCTVAGVGLLSLQQ